MAVPGSLKYLESLVNSEWAYGVVTSAYLATMVTWVTPTEPAVHDMEYTYADDTGEVNGQTGATTHDLESKSGALSRKFNCSSEVLAAYLARILGNVTSSAAGSAANEVQKLVITGGTTAGTVVLIRGAYQATLDVDGLTSGEVQTAYNALYAPSNGDVAAVTVTGSAGDFTITFNGVGATNKSWDEPRYIITEALSPAGTVTISTQTQGRAAGAYTHNFKWPSGCIVTPYSFAIIEGYACGATTGTYKLVKGVVVDSLDFNMSGKGFIELTLGLKTAGIEEDVPSTVFATNFKVVTRLTGGMARLYIGVNADSTDEIPAADIRSIKITINAGMTAAENVGGGTAVQAYNYGEGKPDLTVEVVVRADKSHRLYTQFQAAEFRNQTGISYKFRMYVDPQAAADRTVEFKMDKCIWTAKPSNEANETRLTLAFLPEYTSGQGGPGQWNIATDVPAYNVAA